MKDHPEDVPPEIVPEGPVVERDTAGDITGHANLLEIHLTALESVAAHVADALIVQGLLQLIDNPDDQHTKDENSLLIAKDASKGGQDHPPGRCRENEIRAGVVSKTEVHQEVPHHEEKGLSTSKAAAQKK